MAEISLEQAQGYVDGFEAAVNMVESMKVRVAAEVDVGIELGRSVALSLLKSQLLALKTDNMMRREIVRSKGLPDG